MKRFWYPVSLLLLCVLGFSAGRVVAGGVDGADPPTVRRELRVTEVEGYRRPAAPQPTTVDEETVRLVLETAPRQPVDLGTGDPDPLSSRSSCLVLQDTSAAGISSSCDVQSELIVDRLRDEGVSSNESWRIDIGSGQCCVCEIYCFGGTGSVCWLDCRCSDPGFYAPGC